jgi:XTP/dITP diphosphohydrolase
MKKILIATTNNSKLMDLQKGFAPLIHAGIELLSFRDLNITQIAPETGKTFLETSRAKAQFYADIAHIPVIADDGGLEIDTLNGEPGVKSHRWTGHIAEDEQLIAYTLERMKGIPEGKRQAHMTTCLCFYDPASQQTFFNEKSVEGHIATQMNNKWTKGYPYRAVFIVDAFQKYYDELSPEEHDQINHRFQAIREMLPQLMCYMVE